VHNLISEVEAASQHFLAERHNVGRLREIPGFMVPHPTHCTTASLHLVHNQIRTRLTKHNQAQFFSAQLMAD